MKFSLTDYKVAAKAAKRWPIDEDSFFDIVGTKEAMTKSLTWQKAHC